MILLRDRNLLFLKAAKTGGTSLEIALSKFATKRDVLTPVSREDEFLRRDLYHGKQVARNFRRVPRPQYRLESLRQRIPRPTGVCFTNHCSAKNAHDALGQDYWNSIFKFAVVRNPWDLAVSLYFWETKKTLEKHEALPGFQRWIHANRDSLQANYEIYKIDGEWALNSYFRYEELETGLRSLEVSHSLHGLADEMKNIKTKTGVRPKTTLNLRDFYHENGEAADEIAETFTELIEKFGYQNPLDF